MPLHVNLEDLLSARTVESNRIEYKAGWNPDAIYRSICAFANDFDNIGGGYILIGVEENSETKVAVRPVKGLTTQEIAMIQKKMIELDRFIQPIYHSKLFIEDIDSQQIIVLWVPGGSNRPYRVPETILAKEKKNFYYIRQNSSSTKASQEQEQELISLANQIPFDDRSNTQAKIDDISILLIKDYLLKVKSKLADSINKLPDLELLGQMELISGPDEYRFPRNVALMMFSEKPEKYFPLTQVEIVYFPNGEAEDFEEYSPITGPVSSQIKQTLDFLRTNFLKEKVSKLPDVPESVRVWNYPLQAIEEILVNAFYHRDYQEREPIEIRINADSMIFINHGGPDRSIQLDAFNTGQVRSRRYRNRRLGEFLKELELTEGRATGIPTILKSLKKNGSRAPRFHTDEDRSFFEVEIFAHPYFETINKFERVARRLEQLFYRRPTLEEVALVMEVSTQKIKEINDVHPILVQKPDINLDTVEWNLIGINKLLDRLLDDRGIARGIAVINSNNTTTVPEPSLQDLNLKTLQANIDLNIMRGIARGIAEANIEKTIELIKLAQVATSRKLLITGINLVNNAKNFETYIVPLVNMGWLSMTIPNKPTSPKQQYVITPKGQLILEILKQSPSS
jgi:ATP-dependent DNA helicase RecG